MLRNTVYAAQDRIVRAGDLYLLRTGSSSHPMVTNHGNLGELFDTDNFQPDIGRLLIYHSFLKLQGQ